MHDSSMNRIREFVKKYIDVNEDIKVLDVGSCQVQRQKSYRELFNSPRWKYYGMDIKAGDNVDIVAMSLYDWGIGISYDVVISGQCLEHVKDVKEWILQVDKCLKPGGTVCIIAPWLWRRHRYPIDCWRILPDGMEFLLKDVCGFRMLECFIKGNDCIGIARKVMK